MDKLNDYIKMIYQAAVEKGWYEVTPKPLERHMLMLSEIAEATEEVRDHKDSYYEVNGKPEGEATEMADVLIRIFDYVGYAKINFPEFLNLNFFLRHDDILGFDELMLAIKDRNNIKCIDELEKLESELEYHMSIAISIGNASNAYMRKSEKEFYFLAEAFIKICYYAQKRKWDIQDIVNKKYEFNKNRPYKHGGKKC